MTCCANFIARKWTFLLKNLCELQSQMSFFYLGTLWSTGGPLGTWQMVSSLPLGNIFVNITYDCGGAVCTMTMRHCPKAAAKPSPEPASTRSTAPAQPAAKEGAAEHVAMFCIRHMQGSRFLF